MLLLIICIYVGLLSIVEYNINKNKEVSMFEGLVATSAVGAAIGLIIYKSQNSIMYVVSYIFPILTLLLVFIHCYRLVKVKKYDAITIILAIALLILCIGTIIIYLL